MKQNRFAIDYLLSHKHVCSGVTDGGAPTCIPRPAKFERQIPNTKSPLKKGFGCIDRRCTIKIIYSFRQRQVAARPHKHSTTRSLTDRWNEPSNNNLRITVRPLDTHHETTPANVRRELALARAEAVVNRLDECRLTRARSPRDNIHNPRLQGHVTSSPREAKEEYFGHIPAFHTVNPIISNTDFVEPAQANQVPSRSARLRTWAGPSLIDLPTFFPTLRGPRRIRARSSTSRTLKKQPNRIASVTMAMDPFTRSARPTRTFGFRSSHSSNPVFLLVPPKESPRSPDSATGNDRYATGTSGPCSFTATKAVTKPSSA